MEAPGVRTPTPGFRGHRVRSGSARVHLGSVWAGQSVTRLCLPFRSWPRRRRSWCSRSARSSPGWSTSPGPGGPGTASSECRRQGTEGSPCRHVVTVLPWRGHASLNTAADRCPQPHLPRAWFSAHESRTAFVLLNERGKKKIRRQRAFHHTRRGYERHVSVPINQVFWARGHTPLCTDRLLRLSRSVGGAGRCPRKRLAKRSRPPGGPLLNRARSSGRTCGSEPGRRLSALGRLQALVGAHVPVASFAGVVSVAVFSHRGPGSPPVGLTSRRCKPVHLQLERAQKTVFQSSVPKLLFFFLF